MTASASSSNVKIRWSHVGAVAVSSQKEPSSVCLAHLPTSEAINPVAPVRAAAFAYSQLWTLCISPNSYIRMLYRHLCFSPLNVLRDLHLDN